MSPCASVAAALMSIALSDSRAPLPTVVGPPPSHAARINDKVTILDLRCTIPVPIHDARERGNATFAANVPRPRGHSRLQRVLILVVEGVLIVGPVVEIVLDCAFRAVASRLEIGSEPGRG